MSNLLEINNLSIDVKIEKSYYNIVNRLSLSIAKKQKYGIVGESGSGKSLTSVAIMNLLADSLSVSEGQILFEETQELTTLSNKEMMKIRGKDISIIFQEPMTALDPIFTIEYQISEVLKIHFNHSKKEMREMIISILKDVGIPRPESIMKSYPHELSGGMRQRVVIAMALICKPKLLIADEPTTALDVTIQAQILELMNELTEKYDTSILMITHDLGVINETCERVAVMYAGEVVEESSVDSLFSHPKHPYTQGLLKSIHTLGDRSEKLYSIPGNVPTPTQLKKHGCRFASRCPHVMDLCKEETPPYVEVSEDQVSKCWLHTERGEYNEQGQKASVASEEYEKTFSD
ncbi:ABC transporter ATP-binding protein [Halobacillus sp. A5]|uniref:ABC transporter ATP-binding protein n=1 Tax=Halobacillus sp. A5 TaxID=2880263 RepID=UPI0020A63DBF|nr:ABC transporter ATP-binding protein [Halobacillus sp. A5]MCP3027909.1 ABC transporter ATP-binding protein [Halobacillus sp. A5]